MINSKKDRNKKRINIECDHATQDRIINMAEISDLCFFGHGLCGAFSSPDGPKCRDCILERAGWIITDK